MKTNNQLFFILFLFWMPIMLGQEIPVFHVSADLNNDKIDDEAIITENANDKDFPFLLEVFLVDKNNNKKLVASTSKLIYQISIGRQPINIHSYLKLYSLEGNLIVEYNFQGEFYKYVFSYQNDNFELINYHGESYKRVENYDQSTEKKTITTENLKTREKETIVKTEKKQFLQDFEANF